jgi:hypothetical protein
MHVILLQERNRFVDGRGPVKQQAYRRRSCQIGLSGVLVRFIRVIYGKDRNAQPFFVHAV